MRAWAERHQIALYLGALAAGLLAGLVFSGAEALAVVINPAIGLLLYVTFLGVPFANLAAAFRDLKFLGALVVLNFVVVPLVVFGLSRFVAHETALLLGVLLVLLTPCVDYVIVFAGLAGGAADRLLAATPLLMLTQLLLLPVYLFMFVGPDTLGIIDAAPFVDAFVWLILVPLIAALVTQALAKRMPPARQFAAAGLAAMVPLMVVVLFVVVASQARAVADQFDALITVVPLYVVFLVVMGAIGILVSRVLRLDAARARALTFSGATRNSLVVLPLALALPAGMELAAAAVVAQTLVELIGMIAYVRLLPRLIR